MFIFSYSISITALTHFLKSHNDSTVSTTINKSLIEMSATLYLSFNFFASFLGVHLYRNNHAAGFGCLIHNLIGLLQANQLEIMSKYCHQTALLFIFLIRKCQSMIQNLVFQFSIFRIYQATPSQSPTVLSAHDTRQLSITPAPLSSWSRQSQLHWPHWPTSAQPRGVRSPLISSAMLPRADRRPHLVPGTAPPPPQ